MVLARHAGRQDFAIEARRKETAREAIGRGRLLRFSAITMTTLGAMSGTLPIAMGYGEGAEAWQPLGLADW